MGMLILSLVTIKMVYENGLRKDSAPVNDINNLRTIAGDRMSRQSLVLMGGQQPTVVYVSDPLRIDSWYTSPDHVQTIAIVMSNFKGRISIEASIKTHTLEQDWFPIQLKGQFYIDYPVIGYGSETSTKTFNFVGRFVWLRARIDRTYVIPDDAMESMVAACGFVDRILLNI